LEFLLPQEEIEQLRENNSLNPAGIKSVLFQVEFPLFVGIPRELRGVIRIVKWFLLKRASKREGLQGLNEPETVELPRVEHYLPSIEVLELQVGVEREVLINWRESLELCLPDHFLSMLGQDLRQIDLPSCGLLILRPLLHLDGAVHRGENVELLRRGEDGSQQIHSGIESLCPFREACA